MSTLVLPLYCVDFVLSWIPNKYFCIKQIAPNSFWCIRNTEYVVSCSTFNFWLNFHLNCCSTVNDFTDFKLSIAIDPCRSEAADYHQQHQKNTSDFPVTNMRWIILQRCQEYLNYKRCSDFKFGLSLLSFSDRPSNYQKLLKT